GAHARAEPGGHHGGCDRSLGHDRVMRGRLDRGSTERRRSVRRRRSGTLAGAPGFEPGIAGPKPAALPLGYAPLRAEHMRVPTAVGSSAGPARPFPRARAPRDTVTAKV